MKLPEDTATLWNEVMVQGTTGGNTYLGKQVQPPLPIYLWVWAYQRFNKGIGAHPTDRWGGGGGLIDSDSVKRSTGMVPRGQVQKGPERVETSKVR